MPSPSPLILAGDLGGTNFRVSVFRKSEDDDSEMERLHFRKFHSEDHHSLEEMVQLFLSGITLESPVQAACFGVPGPNVAGVVTLSNLGWKIDTHTLPQSLGIQRVAVLNDLEATAYGL